MKRVSVYILFALMTGTVTAKPSGSLLQAASFPKTADDLTLAQRIDLLTEGYEPFDTIFENGVCVQNCPYVGISLKDYEAQLSVAAQQVARDLSELGYTSSDNNATPQGVDTASVNNTVYEFLAQTPESVDLLSEKNKAALASIVMSDGYQAQYPERLNVDEQNIMKYAGQILDVTDGDIKDLIRKIRETNGRQREQPNLPHKQNPFNPDGSVHVSPDSKETPFAQHGDVIPVGCPMRLNPVRVSSEQGMRKLKTESRARMHAGIDLACSVGTTLYAPADGVVVEKKIDGKGLNKGYGRYLVIQHSRNYYTLYGHLDSWLVEKGAHVSAGQPIAKSGNTGSSSGPHLHYEVTLNGPSYNGGTPTDPRNISRCPYNPAKRAN